MLQIDEIEDDEYDEIVAEKRHKELIGALSKLAAAVTLKDDKQLVDAINSQPTIFKEAVQQIIKSIPKQEIPQVNVDIDYKNLLSSFKQISDAAVDKIEASNNKIIEVLQSRLLPDTFDLLKSYGGVTQSVKVNYKQANQLKNK